MMRQRFITAAIVAPLMLLTACGAQNLLMPSKGKLAVSVTWPKKATYTVQTIPQETTHIEVTILGEGIPGASPLHTTLTPSGQSESTDFLEVPIGPKVVQAIAFDAQNHEVAFGEKLINVEPNKLTEAHVDLKPEPATIEPSPEGSPSPGASPKPSPSPTATPTPGPVIDTVAGGADKLSLDNQDPLAARFYFPRSLAYDYGAQVLYIED
ncbi:MAG: hypothetical protein JWM80_5767, partial [Cyanobacteria bacterium RYN_339]|nr:hypothetical protein [Cyanobacteria bacterium RYN_339]